MISTVTRWPNNSTPRYLPKRTENLRARKSLDTKVHSSTIHHSLKVETTPRSIPSGMNKVGHSHTMWHHLAVKQSEMLSHGTTWVNPESIMLRERNKRRHIVWFQANAYRKSLRLPGAVRSREGRGTAKMSGVPLHRYMNVLKTITTSSAFIKVNLLYVNCSSVKHFLKTLHKLWLAVGPWGRHQGLWAQVLLSIPERYLSPKRAIRLNEMIHFKVLCKLRNSTENLVNICIFF